jgi:tetratricopeptide (TPR) repeat protein
MNQTKNNGIFRRGAFLGCLFLSLVCLTGCITMPMGMRGPGGPDNLDKARRNLLHGETTSALLIYQHLSSTTSDASLAAEYAYALALDGHPDAAFQQVDRARQMDPANDDVWFYSARILRLTGHESLASALWPEGRRGTPKWVSGKVSQTESAFKGGRGSAKAYGTKDAERFARANALAAQNFLVSAAVAFEGQIAAKPDDAAAHAGYSIVLERLGAYSLAIREDDKVRDLTSNKNVREVLANRSKDLKAKARVAGKNGQGSSARVSPKGRWLIYGGGQVNTGTDTSQTTVSGRIGKFLTSYFDAGVNIDYVSTPAVKAGPGSPAAVPATSAATFGVSARLTPSLPLNTNFIIGGRLAFAKEQNGSTFSLGLAKRNPKGEMDLTVDFGSGLYKGTGMTVGYTIYLGGR